MAVRILSSQDRSRAIVTGLVFLAIGAALFFLTMLRNAVFGVETLDSSDDD